MEFDLLYEMTVAKPWDGGQSAAERRCFQDAIEQVRLADEVGFRTAWFVEHHFREGRSHCSSPEVVIGALSQVTNRIRLGFGVSLMPHGFNHPVRNAERVATADVLTNGRVEWGTGRSTPGEQSGFGVPQGEESRAQWRDAIKSVVEMWSTDRFSWDSPYLKFEPPRPVVPKPIQTPHPPPWVAVVSEGSAVTAGNAGLGMLCFSILNPVENMAKQIREYRAAAANPSAPLTRVSQNRVAAYTLVHCAETTEQAEANGAWDAVWWWYQNHAELALEWDFPHYPEEKKAEIFPLLKERAAGKFDVTDFAKEDMVIVGDVEEVITKMKRYADAGVDQLICYSEFGHLSHESILKSIELIGREVLPVMRDYVPNPDAFNPDADTKTYPAYRQPGLTLSPTGITETVKE